VIGVPSIVVPKTRIATGAGYLFKAPLGTLIPGQVSKSVSNKALTSNVATITTSAAHGLVAGDQVVVSIGDTTFDGLYTIIAAPLTTTFTYARVATDVVSAAATGTAISYATSATGGTVAGSVFTDAWPAGWVPIGVTKDGSTFEHAPKTANVEVAEYLLPVRIVTTGVEDKVSFEIAEMTAKNFAFSLNGGSVTTRGGTGATLLTEVNAPVVGAEVRQMIGWESEDSTERAVYIQGFQSGSVKVARKKGADNATIAVEFTLEQPSVGQPYRQFYAGAVTVGS
jgi:hypothetical protein